VRRPLELVIFDNDGVLVDSEPHAQRVTIALLTELGWPLSPDDCTERFLGRSLPADFEDRYHAGLFEAFATGLTPIPGVTEALGRIAVPACVASSGSHERLRLALTTTGLFDRFAGRIFSAQDVTRGKPAPDLFLHAARTLGVDPTRCAVIEGNPAGVEAANAAGMLALGYAGVTPAAG
jgi:HAD superfamily hydrolase (TIGR01509 family)